MGHDITLDKELDDGTEVYRCSNCGLSYTSEGAFDIFACTSMTEPANRSSSTPPESINLDDE